MPDRPRHRVERLSATFLLGVALFMPPLLAAVSRETTVGGIPVLYLWLFGGWLVLIAVLALVVELPRHPGDDP